MGRRWEREQADGHERAEAISSSAVEPDEKFRTRLTIQSAAPERPSRTRSSPWSRPWTGNDRTVVVFGPGWRTNTGLAQAQRLSRQHPEMGVVLVSEELSLPALQQALACRRARCTGPRQPTTRRASGDRSGRRVHSSASRTAPGSGPAEIGRVIVTLPPRAARQEHPRDQPRVPLASVPRSRWRFVDGDLQFGDRRLLLGIPPTHHHHRRSGPRSTRPTSQ